MSSDDVREGKSQSTHQSTGANTAAQHEAQVSETSSSTSGESAPRSMQYMCTSIQVLSSLPGFAVLPQLYLCEGVIACNEFELSNFTMRMLRSGEVASSGLCATGCSNSQAAVFVSERSDGQTSGMVLANIYIQSTDH